MFAFLDAAVVFLSYSAALSLRFIDARAVPPGWARSFIVMIPIIVAVHLAANLAAGAYGHVWRFASVEEALRLVLAVAASATVLIVSTLVYRAVFGAQGPLPLTVIAVGAGLTLGGMGALRFRARLFSYRRVGDGLPATRVLVVGEGQAGADLARRGRTADRPVEVVGFVACARSSGPRQIAGRPVMGTIEQLGRLVELLRIDEVVVLQSMGHEAMKTTVDALLHSRARIRMLPDVERLMDDRSGFQDVRDLDIHDLLPRSEVHLDLDPVRAALRGKRVMVTGAGGSIGSEIVRQLLATDASVVIALDRDETHLYDARLRWGTDQRIVSVLADVASSTSVARAIARWRPQIVFHAAASKHVPILETAPEEAVRTNIAGTQTLLEALRMSETFERFVLISTDKAVAPTSVMGASKRVAELLVQSAAEADPDRVYTAVRFGNVMGSRGSVVPTFAHQIAAGGPVTVSDERMTRYFMTIDEAVELVLHAATIAQGGDIMVLDMGKPLKIIDLAHRMIRLAGLVPGRDIEVKITGARPGEKLHEILSSEPLVPSPHPKISIALAERPFSVALADAVEELLGLAEEGDEVALRRLLFEVAGGRASDAVVDLRRLDDQREAAAAGD